MLRHILKRGNVDIGSLAFQHTESIVSVKGQEGRVDNRNNVTCQSRCVIQKRDDPFGR